jgi:hypothetical protein
LYDHGNTGGVRVILRGNSPYRQTGALAADIGIPFRFP